MYELRAEATLVPDNWLFTSVIPGIQQRWREDHRFCKVMALAKLWVELDEEASTTHLMTLAHREQIEHSKLLFGLVDRTASPS